MEKKCYSTMERPDYLMNPLLQPLRPKAQFIQEIQHASILDLFIYTLTNDNLIQEYI